MVIGCDTGFFKHLLDGHPTALEVWRQAEAKEHHLVLSCISLFELSRLGLKGALPREQAEQLVANLPLACEVVWLSERNAALLAEAARVAHGNALSMADALILVSLAAAGAERIYTTDSDLLAYRHGPEMVRV